MSALTSERAADDAIAYAIPLLDRRAVLDRERDLREEVFALRDLAITCRVWGVPLNPADVLRVSDTVDSIARALRWERHDKHHGPGRCAMSDLTDKIALFDVQVHHVSEVTEAAVREQIAADIEARRKGSRTVGYVEGWDDALDIAEQIAQGGTR